MTTKMFSGKALRLSLVAASLALASSGVANATLITQSFTATTGCGVANCGTNGGTVTFEDSLEPGSGLAANQLQITLDNTTVASLVGTSPTYKNSSAITGFVFNIDEHINGITSWTFVDGNDNDISSDWGVQIDHGGSISNNTVFDIYFAAGNIIGGIYNAADPGSNLDNVFPDIAKLILTISDPNPYTLNSVGSDSILRMQRVGTSTNGDEGSLKIVTSSSSSTSSSSTTSGQTSGSTGNTVPEPGMLALLGIGFLGQALLLGQRRRRLQ